MTAVEQGRQQIASDELFRQFRPLLERIDIAEKRQALFQNVIGAYGALPDEDITTSINKLRVRPTGKRHTLSKAEYKLTFLQDGEVEELSSTELVNIATQNSTWLRVAFQRGEPLRMPAGLLLLRAGHCDITGQSIDLSGMGPRSIIRVIDLADSTDPDTWFYGGSAITGANETLTDAAIRITSLKLDNPTTPTVVSTSSRGKIVECPIMTLIEISNVNNIWLEELRSSGKSYHTRLHKLTGCENVVVLNPTRIGGNIGRLISCVNTYVSGVSGQGATLNTELDISSQDAEWSVIHHEYGRRHRVYKSKFKNCAHGPQFWGGDSAIRNVLGVQTGYVSVLVGRGIADVHYIDVEVEDSMSGIWGSMGEGIRKYRCRLKNCKDVGSDDEGNINSKTYDSEFIDCGFYTGGANIATFNQNFDIAYYNCTSRITDGTALFTGIDDNVPDTYPSCQHFFLSGGREDIGGGYTNGPVKFYNCQFICEKGIVPAIRYCETMHEIGFYDRCKFVNTELNLGVLFANRVIVENTVFEYTETVSRNIVPLNVTSGKSVSGHNGYLRIEGSEFRYKPGINTGYTRVDTIIFCPWTNGRSEIYYLGNDNTGTLNLNFKYNPDPEAEDYVEPTILTVPTLVVEKNRGLVNYLLEKTEGIKEPTIIWNQNRSSEGNEYRPDQMTVRIGANITPDLYSSTDRYVALFRSPAIDNQSNFTGVNIRGQCSNDASNKWTFWGEYGTRQVITRHFRVSGLYSVEDPNQRSISIQIRTGEIDPNSPTGAPYLDFFAVIKSGYNFCYLEIESGNQLLTIPGYRMFELVGDGVGGDIEYDSNNIKPDQWFPHTGENLMKVKLLDNGSETFRKEYMQAMFSPIKEQFNIFYRHQETGDIYPLIPEINDLDADNLAALNFGFVTRGNFDYGKIHDLSATDFLNLLWSLIEFRYGITPVV